ncbi:DJ-1 family protein [Candidatus Micrarchaeota archaeon]|nr:MAG: DJ-1 family protein [Candidatus Micrarchaeota archaeon]
MKTVLMIIAPENFRDEELFHTKEELEKAGFSVKIASKQRGIRTGKLGAKAEAEFELSELQVDDYDAVVFVGGPGAAQYFTDKEALEIARKAHETGKVLAAICIAPVILGNAGLLSGRKVTAWPSVRSKLEELGAVYTGKGVEVDGKIITGNGPDAARDFGRKIAELLGA